MSEAIDKCSELLCGSSWKSELELEAILKAKLQNKKSRVFLDHWINYNERFCRNGEAITPDEFIVGDNEALLLAKIAGPTQIPLISHAYLRIA